jgi:hypothetical protein
MRSNLIIFSLLAIVFLLIAIQSYRTFFVVSPSGADNANNMRPGGFSGNETASSSSHSRTISPNLDGEIALNAGDIITNLEKEERALESRLKRVQRDLVRARKALKGLKNQTSDNLPIVSPNQLGNLSPNAAQLKIKQLQSEVKKNAEKPKTTKADMPRPQPTRKPALSLPEAVEKTNSKTAIGEVSQPIALKGLKMASSEVSSGCPYDFRVYVYDIPASLGSVRISFEARKNKTLHICQKCILEQFALEYIVYDFFTQFCGRTTDPEAADFFYLPIVRDAEFRVAMEHKNRAPSLTEQALLEILEKVSDSAIVAHLRLLLQQSYSTYLL